MFDDVDLNENEDMSNPNERPRSMLARVSPRVFVAATD